MQTRLLSIACTTVAAALFVLCHAAHAQQPFQQQVPPTAAVQVPPPPPPHPGARYQYMCITKMNVRMYEDDVLRKLNELGSQGWRLLPPMIARGPGQSYADVYCFEKAY